QNDEINLFGKDEIKLSVSETKLKNLSSGELNRLRLAFIATECKILNSGRGIIFLDEIDANLSGKEAMSIAKVLEELSRFYQIFAISHLPQLSSKAHNHFLVEKNGKQSYVKKLEKEERIKELARMVSGEQISDEALQFARTLFED
ncbi:TPA: DNA recombination protein RecN, partial [Campylobacter upsaliensis]|nr:DNA recombination protein RecN [Campylobacter upsaliensis]